jgi:hypothetical protein
MPPLSIDEGATTSAFGMLGNHGKGAPGDQLPSNFLYKLEQRLSLESVGGHVLGLGARHQNAFCSSR